MTQLDGDRAALVQEAIRELAALADELRCRVREIEDRIERLEEERSRDS